ncbi:hypothetical protein Tco_0296317 [Tanacetum coccineum]
MQSSLHTTKCDNPDTKAKRSPKPVISQSESVSKEDIRSNKLGSLGKSKDDDKLLELGKQKCRPRLMKQELEAHYSYMAKIQEVSPEESSSTSQPLEQVQNHDENDVFANMRRHSEQPESINKRQHMFWRKDDKQCHS